MVRIIPFFEHENAKIEVTSFHSHKTYFNEKGSDERTCFEIYQSENEFRIKLSYFIGLDWINDRDAVLVSPKLNSISQRIDYLKMLSACLTHPDILDETADLFQIDFSKPSISIRQELDLLTPLLVINFLQVMRPLVKKGIKKGYYQKEENITSKVKGKIVVSRNFKENVLKNRIVKTVCNFQEFGINTYENRLLKRTLQFILRYVANHESLRTSSNDTLKFCLVPFQQVSDTVEIHEMKYIHINPIFKEYGIAVRLGKLILQRFGYNMHAIDKSAEVPTPPFWIDMSRLFELHVLGKLKDRFKHNVKYHFKRKYNELDYLINTPEYKIIADAKYKKKYDTSYGMDDIRQLSGYARLEEVSRELQIDEKSVIDCLIVYPDQSASEELPEDLKAESIDGFISFYKAPIKLPVIERSVGSANP